jgi:hypothetical protein
LLLDAHSPDWRSHLTAESDLGEMLRKALGLERPQSVKETARKLIATYGAEKLVAAERDQEKLRNHEQLRLRTKFTDSPTLTLPLQNMQMSFYPSRNVPIDGIGTVYGNLIVTDAWGKLTSTGEALISHDFTSLIVSIGSGENLSEPLGDDWKLEIAPGWIAKSLAENANWVVQKP